MFTTNHTNIHSHENQEDYTAHCFCPLTLSRFQVSWILFLKMWQLLTHFRGSLCSQWHLVYHKCHKSSRKHILLYFVSTALHRCTKTSLTMLRSSNNQQEYKNGGFMTNPKTSTISTSNFFKYTTWQTKPGLSHHKVCHGYILLHTTTPSSVSPLAVYSFAYPQTKNNIQATIFELWPHSGCRT